LPEKDGVCSGEFLVLRDFNGYLPFLKYYLLSYDFIMLVNASTYGAKMPRANWNFIGNCTIPLPPSYRLMRYCSFFRQQSRTNYTHEIINKLTRHFI